MDFCVLFSDAKSFLPLKYFHHENNCWLLERTSSLEDVHSDDEQSYGFIVEDIAESELKHVKNIYIKKEEEEIWNVIQELKVDVWVGEGISEWRQQS